MKAIFNKLHIKIINIKFLVAVRNPPQIATFMKNIPQRNIIHTHIKLLPGLQACLLGPVTKTFLWASIVKTSLSAVKHFVFKFHEYEV